MSWILQNQKNSMARKALGAGQILALLEYGSLFSSVIDIG